MACYSSEPFFHTVRVATTFLSVKPVDTPADRQTNGGPLIVTLSNSVHDGRM